MKGRKTKDCGSGDCIVNINNHIVVTLTKHGRAAVIMIRPMSNAKEQSHIDSKEMSFVGE